MKSCIRIPKVYIPRKDFAVWPSLDRDRFAFDRAYWERVERALGDSPSALRFLLPEECSEEELKAYAAAVHEEMYRLLEGGALEKLNRGAVLVKRETSSGVRDGIVLCIDLEAYTMSAGEVSLIRPSQEFDMEKARELCVLRSGAPLEFPHVTLFYRDKREKIVRWLGEELEEIYSVSRSEGNIRGYFIPEFDAAEVAADMYGKGEPCFAAADGEEALAAAKLHWEALKPALHREEIVNHPARFLLAEFINLYEDSVVLKPLHRLVREVEPEVFCDFFAKRVKCKRKGNSLYPAIRDGAEAVKIVDAVIAEFMKKNGGRVHHVREEALKMLPEDGVAVVFNGIEKEELFSYLKGGALLPRHTFVLGEEADGRYHLEGREISYD